VRVKATQNSTRIETSCEHILRVWLYL
jgi:hypothetical protein